MTHEMNNEDAKNVELLGLNRRVLEILLKVNGAIKRGGKVKQISRYWHSHSEIFHEVEMRNQSLGTLR